MSFRVEELDSANNKDITRSIAGGGTYIIIFSLYFLVNRLLEKRTSIFLTMPIVFMFLIALAVTYGRGVWLATGVGFIISAYLFRGMRGAVLVSMLGALFIIILYGSFSVVKPRIADAIYERASGFFTEVDHGDSLGWRKMENRLAITSIENNPFLGVGLGGEYKLTMSSRGSFLNETRYIHNGYLYYPLKMGLIAAFIPFALIYGFVRTYRESRTSPLIDDRALLAATGGAFCVPVITSFTQPEWANISGIAAFSVLISFVILYRMHGSFLDTQNDPK
jgi:O-antigen ligase